MANCAACHRLGLQIIAHYRADLTAGKEAECYYHHFGMPLPRSLGEQVAKPKPAEATVDDDREDEGSDAPLQEKTRPRPQHGSINARAGLDPNVCAECWKKGHVCTPHCNIDGERLCIDCADGKPCAHDREQAKHPPRRLDSESYKVKLPGVKKPRAANVALVTNDAGSVVGVKRTAAAAAPVEEHFPQHYSDKSLMCVVPASTRALCWLLAHTQQNERGKISAHLTAHRLAQFRSDAAVEGYTFSDLGSPQPAGGGNTHARKS
jgi:hypothetical protein